MIAISRKQVRALRTFFRRCGDSSSVRSAVVLFDSGPDGLRVQCRAGAWAVEQKFDGQYEPAIIGIPLAALADFEGSSRDNVNVEADGDKSVLVQWTDAGVPQQRKYKAADIAKTPPLEAPTDLSPVGDIPVFEELTELCRSTAKDASRYVLNCIQLRGQSGEAVATDGMQLLKSNGFFFPWNDDVLIPRTKLFEWKELVGTEPVRVARTDDHVVLCKGNWTIWTPIEKNGRFPDVDVVIKAAGIAKTSIELADADANFLAQTIPSLPGANTEDSPVTVHCNGHFAIRAKDDVSSAVTELSLDGSTVAGDEILVVTNRRFLARAASLGMKKIHFRDAKAPALCTADRRVFIWQPLPGEGLKPDANATVIHSGAQVRVASAPQPVERKSEAMTPMMKPQKQAAVLAPEPEVTPEPVAMAPETPVDPIEEVEAIKGVLRGVLIRTSRLAGSLRRQQKAAKIVKSTLLSLRQLSDVG